jgi:hypothetical protein
LLTPETAVASDTCAVEDQAVAEAKTETEIKEEIKEI